MQVSYDEFGETKTYDLVKGGGDINVNAANREEYAMPCRADSHLHSPVTPALRAQRPISTRPSRRRVCSAGAGTLTHLLYSISQTRSAWPALRYVGLYCKYLLADSVARQFGAFQRGFHSV